MNISKLIKFLSLQGEKNLGSLFYLWSLFKGSLFKGSLFKGSLFKEFHIGSLFRGSLFKGSLFRGSLFAVEPLRGGYYLRAFYMRFPKKLTFLNPKFTVLIQEQYLMACIRYIITYTSTISTIIVAFWNVISLCASSISNSISNIVVRTT